MASPTYYITTQGDTWDIISFKLYSNEYYIDQLVAINPFLRLFTIFDAGIVVLVPNVLRPEVISNAVFGNIIRYA
jgi:hypothetical protein